MPRCLGPGRRTRRRAAQAQPVGPDANRRAPGGEFPIGEVAKFIDGRFDVPGHGSREMPVWGQRFGSDIPETQVAESITRGRIAALVEFLKSIQRPLVAPTD